MLLNMLLKMQVKRHNEEHVQFVAAEWLPGVEVVDRLAICQSLEAAMVSA